MLQAVSAGDSQAYARLQGLHEGFYLAQLYLEKMKGVFSGIDDRYQDAEDTGA